MTLMADLLLGARGGGSGPRMPSWAPWQRCERGLVGPLVPYRRAVRLAARWYGGLVAAPLASVPRGGCRVMRERSLANMSQV